MTYPDYNRSLLALISSVLKHYGVNTPHKTLPEFDNLLEKKYKNIVVMVFDGMGTAILERHLPHFAFLRRQLAGSISSVFPPTTTAATVTLLSGLSPIEHGWLGWSLYFDELDANVSIFPNTLSGTGGQKAADYHVAGRYIKYKSVFEKITEATGGRVGAHFVSPFSEYKVKCLNEICDAVKRLCLADGQKYIYTYWHQPDYDMHDLGTKHERISCDIRQINDSVESLCRSLSDTLVIVTADHGMVDTEWRYIKDYPDLADCLLRQPSIESRAMTFFVKPGMKTEFESAFNAHFGDYYILYTKEKALDTGLFGPGTPNTRAVGFIGDYFAIATGNVSIESTPSKDHDVFKAAHAGMTYDEMTVPFIVFEC